MRQDETPVIPNLATLWWWVVTLTLRPWQPPIRTGGPQRVPELCEREKNVFVPEGQLSCRPALWAAWITTRSGTEGSGNGWEGGGSAIF